jgi:hypothetical protein
MCGCGNKGMTTFEYIMDKREKEEEIREKIRELEERIRYEEEKLSKQSVPSARSVGPEPRYNYKSLSEPKTKGSTGGEYFIDETSKGSLLNHRQKRLGFE